MKEKYIFFNGIASEWLFLGGLTSTTSSPGARKSNHPTCSDLSEKCLFLFYFIFYLMHPLKNKRQICVSLE